MKLLKNWSSLIVASALAVGSLSLFSCGPDVEPEEPVVLRVNPTSISMISTSNSSATISIECTDSWMVTERPDWVNLSSTSGNGNTTVVVTSLTANETSTPRTGILTITCRDLKSVVELTQLAGLQSGCDVTVVDEVILTNSATFKLRFGAKASYFYAGYFPAASAGWSDDRIVAALENGEPLNAEPDMLISTDEDLTANSNYIQCVVAYDASGKRGDVFRRSFTTTNPDRTKSPQVYIKEITYNNSLWKWLTEKNATTTDYFMLAVSGDIAVDYYFASTSLIGMIIKESADYENSYVNGQYWQLARKSSDNYLYVATWARREQKWSPMIVDQIVWTQGATPVASIPATSRMDLSSGEFKPIYNKDRAKFMDAAKIMKI